MGVHLQIFMKKIFFSKMFRSFNDGNIPADTYFFCFLDEWDLSNEMNVKLKCSGATLGAKDVQLLSLHLYIYIYISYFSRQREFT